MPLASKKMSDRVMVFIDFRNIKKSVENIESSLFRLDYYALVKQLVGPRELLAAYVFDTKRPMGEDDPARRFHDKLNFDGFRVVARESFDPNKKEQKEVDVAMACEMLSHALKDHYDVAIVVSGDADFIPAIEHVQAAGKKVEVAAFSNSVSHDIKKVADAYYELNQLPLLSARNVFNELSIDPDEVEEIEEVI